MTTFFTADLHLGHGNIIKYCSRPFTDVHEMNVALTDNWNRVVTPQDTIYILGDFCLNAHPEKYLEKLNGHKILIRGSHDDKKGSSFEKVYDLCEFKENNTRITLCHYAMRKWPHGHHGAWHLYGHSHGKLEPLGKSFDVGVDCWNFTPVSLEQVKEKMDTLIV